MWTYPEAENVRRLAKMITSLARWPAFFKNWILGMLHVVKAAGHRGSGITLVIWQRAKETKKFSIKE